MTDSRPEPAQQRIAQLEAALRLAWENVTQDHQRLLMPGSPGVRAYCEGCTEVGDCDLRDDYEAAMALLAASAGTAAPTDA
jgi:hypothetical protein